MLVSESNLINSVNLDNNNYIASHASNISINYLKKKLFYRNYGCWNLKQKKLLQNEPTNIEWQKGNSFKLTFTISVQL